MHHETKYHLIYLTILTTLIWLNISFTIFNHINNINMVIKKNMFK